MDAASFSKLLLCGSGGLAAGMLSGLFGVGGGMVLIPLLSILVGLDQHRVQGMTLAVLLPPVGLPALLSYHRRGLRIPGTLVAWLCLGFLGGSGLGSLLANALSGQVLRWTFILFMLLMAVRTWRKSIKFELPEAHPDPPGNWNALPIGFLAGLASGLLGIGGGLVIIPLLSWRLGLNQHRAQMASLALLSFPVGLPSVWIYSHLLGGLPWVLLGAVFLGFLPGALLGARFALKLGGPKLSRAFAVFLLIMAALMGLKA